MIALRLEALRAGAGADGFSWSGEIHSVFARACNIEVAPGRLLGLLVLDVGAMPGAFVLATPPGFRFDDYVDEAKSAACRDGILRIEGALSVDLRTARPWRSELQHAPIDVRDENIARAWRAAWAAFADHGAGAAFATRAAAPIALLVRATRTRAVPSARQAVAALIGLGDGLTPAGDDFLVGFMAGLWNTSQTPVRAAFRDAVAEAISANISRTGTISRHYLEAAVAGEVAEALARLAVAIGNGDGAAAARAAATALAVGASSGAAATHGLLLAAQANGTGGRFRAK